MKQLNHLKTFESFTTNEEFNPLKREDWKSAGNYIRKGVGFLSNEEKMEQAKKIVLNHPVRSKIYKKFLNEDPYKADMYLLFWSENDQYANPVWDSKARKFVDKAKYSYDSGPGGIGAW